MGSNLTTIQGQAWDQLAKEHLGSEFAMHKIMEANIEACGVLLFSGDKTIAVPDVAPEDAKSPEASLPPWKR